MQRPVRLVALFVCLSVGTLANAEMEQRWQKPLDPAVLGNAVAASAWLAASFNEICLETDLEEYEKDAGRLDEQGFERVSYFADHVPDSVGVFISTSTTNGRLSGTCHVSLSLPTDDLLLSQFDRRIVDSGRGTLIATQGLLGVVYKLKDEGLVSVGRQSLAGPTKVTFHKGAKIN